MDMNMNKLVCIFREGLYFSLSIFLITFPITLYVKGNPNVFGIMYILVSFLSGVLSLLSKLSELFKLWKLRSWEKIKNISQLLKLYSFLKEWESVIKVSLIMVSVLNILLYISAYNKFNYIVYNIISYAIVISFISYCLLNIYIYRKQFIVLLLTSMLVFVFICSLGILAYADVSLPIFIFLFGLLFTVIENLEKFVKLDNCYPKEIVTLENDEKIKKNKVVLNFIMGILFFLIYIIFKILELEAVKKCIFQRTILGELKEVLAVGMLRVLSIEILIIILLFILGFTKRSDFDNSTSRYIKKSASENIFEVVFNIVSLGIKSKSLPKVEERVAIGKEIDKINPEILIENRREIPKDIHVLLSKVEDRPTIRNLLIIYPNKEVYRCKFNIGEDIVTRITEVELVDP